MKKKLTILLAILFIGFVGLGAYDLRNNQIELKLKDIKLQDSVLELNKIELEKQELNKKFEEAINEGKINEEKAKQLESEKLELEERTRQLERDLQAKREREANEKQFANNTSKVVAGASTEHNVTGNKQQWLVASGIPESEWWAVDSIVSRESSWNPNAINPESGACGLGQQLPCGKWAGAWNDPVAALKAQYGYVVARYGGYPQAVAFWNANHWY